MPREPQPRLRHNRAATRRGTSAPATFALTWSWRDGYAGGLMTPRRSRRAAMKYGLLVATLMHLLLTDPPPLFVLRGYTALIRCVRYSPDGWRIATAPGAST